MREPFTWHVACETVRTEMSKNHHDSIFRTVFSNPKYARKLLELAANRNESLRNLLSLINLETLRQIPGDAPREGLGGNADVAFHVNLLNGNEELLVGILLEHKSFPDYGVREQLLKYYIEVMQQRDASVPMVAVVVYNGSERWTSLGVPYRKYPGYFQEVGLPFKVEFIDIGDEISVEEFNNLDPLMKLVLVAMRYVFDTLGMKEKFSSILKDFIRAPSAESRRIVEELVVYLKNVLPTADKEALVDTLEALQNKGYESIADAERKEIERKVLENTREIAKKMRDHGDAIDYIASVSGLSEEDIRTL